MNRVPPMEGGQSSSASLERKVTFLTVFTVLQGFLLLVLYILHFSSGNVGPAGSSAREDSLMAETVIEDVEPVVSTPERGTLPEEVPLDRAVRVQILNGIGINGLAGRFSNALRREGYDIREVADADRHDYSYSVIYDRTGLSGQAGRFGQLLGIPSQRTIRQSNPDLVDVDITFIIGSDWESLNITP